MSERQTMPVTSDPLARRYRRLLLGYPRAYRRERGEELLATLLEAAPPGRTRPAAREAANLIGHGLRARLGRPRSRSVVTWAVFTAVICGLFTAALATRLAWETSPPMPDRAEAAAILAEVLPGHRFPPGDVNTAEALFAIYGEPLSLDSVNDLLFGDGGEYALTATTAYRTGFPPVPLEQTAAAAEQSLRDGGWTVYPATHNEMYGCAGPPCDPATIPQDTRLFAKRGDLTLELDLYPQQQADSTYLAVSLSRTTPAAVWPAAIAAGLLGAAVGWLLFGWASRRTQAPHPARVPVDVLFGVTMGLWWLPVLFTVPFMVEHHLGEPHPRWHPLWEWLGQPVFSLFLVAGCVSALLGLALTLLPSRRTQPQRVATT
ncbi:hypothetical protein CS0771_61240 [Catellatospora sp. IY07-71]|uniref:hypothetical protein n=1 Tax=Catellatospora sp. IY07-71 TaxID=2728827 RepID=UPI001BB39924|nr:hypothetical protein [Catellatospora sp. IY07-71]BCJ76580.1 hypothetical protein CS0771_61240 [Catellatospora sp. IY07-71]